MINGGNANAATGEPGKQDAHNICESVAELMSIDAHHVQPFSTGVIGERLDVPALTLAVASAAATLRSDGWLSAASAIMTTDTVPKLVSKRIALSTGEIVVTGMAKGSGMMKPDMATMLFVACNANISPPLLKQLTKDLANQSFNRISVDGDTSTNDCFMLAATGCSDTDEIETTEDKDYAPLLDGLAAVQQLAQAIVREVRGYQIRHGAGNWGSIASGMLGVAYTVAESPLVKTRYLRAMLMGAFLHGDWSSKGCRP